MRSDALTADALVVGGASFSASGRLPGASVRGVIVAAGRARRAP